MPWQFFVCSVPSVRAQFEDWGETGSQSVFSACVFLASIYNHRSKFSEITQYSLCVYGTGETPLVSHFCFEQGRDSKSGSVRPHKFRASHAVDGWCGSGKKNDLRRTWYGCRLDVICSRPVGDMNKFNSMQVVEPQNRRESFKFVSEAKRNVWKDGTEERAEPSCCLSVSEISYTVR